MYSSFVRIAALIALASALALAPPAMGQGTATSTPKQTAGREATPAIGSAERNFISKAAMDGMAEVQEGKFAATNAATDQVRSFAQRMVDDHGKANEELKRIAAIKGVKLPDDANQRPTRIKNNATADFIAGLLLWQQRRRQRRWLSE